jgi:HTH-type transcriptional regulator/antitoxin HigA
MTLGTEASQSYADLLRENLPRSITTEAEADAIQRQIDALIDKPGELSEAEEEFLSLLGDLMLVWEDGKYRLPDIYGREAIRGLLQERDLQQKDLVGPVFPTKGIASEVLSGKRSLTYEYVRRLAEFFHVSPAVFYPSGSR